MWLEIYQRDVFENENVKQNAKEGVLLLPAAYPKQWDYANF